MTAIRFRLNDVDHAEDVAPRLSLADLLRERHNLTATHLGCEHGVCGACTVLVDGMPARACLMLAAACDDRQIHSLEGLRDDPIIAALRDSFHRRHAVQCGFCTPGMLITLTELLRDNSDPTEHDVREALSGNLCRCTGYAGIVAATLDAAQRLREGG